ncbi:MAG TPA: excinuclease ABC subunit UvrA, partial [Gammaproteobacteria bacterium]|nr:excinuclease ABC subunit UvrA [Gammaproteobacteria bacterium]
PVLKDRKGEHKQLIAQLIAQGFIRARIDGEITELSNNIEFDPKRKHTIEVVVDRFKVREDIALRLAESLETALNLTDGVALLSPMDETGEETTFSSKFACPHCGYSLNELEPRLFSFNNPNGACPTCDG